MKKNLTDKAVRGLRPGAARYDVWDAGFSGGAFGLRVAPSGRKTWQWMGRDKRGKKRRGTVGTYPEKGLSEARQQAREALLKLFKGESPRKPDGPTFGDLARDFMRKHPKMKGLAARTVAEYRRILDADLLPAWGEWGCKDIKRGDVAGLLDEIAFERESPVMSNRVLALASVVFNYAIDSGRFGLEVNPCFRMRKRTEERPRDRTLTDDEIRAVWAEAGRRPAGAVYRLLLLTGQRSGEVKAMNWSDIEGDVWTIPAELSKNRKLHRVPLSSQALRVLGKPGNGWVFPSRKGGPLRRLQKTTSRIREAVKIDFRVHDLRRTVGTRLARLGFDDALIARVLNHSWALNVTSIYVVHDRIEEKRRALQAWGDALDAILGEEKARTA